MKALALLLLAGCTSGDPIQRYQAGRCAELKTTAAISQRAAQICTAELVGCGLSFEQLQQVLRDQEAAKACK